MPSENQNTVVLAQIIRLRWLVGLLGSKKHFGWWDCAFMDETGVRFLATTFPRSAGKAALLSTSEGAQRVHDRELGRKGSFHLFRLPTGIEDLLEFEDDEAGPVFEKDSAMAELAQLADASVQAPPGPVQIGVEGRILTKTSIQEMAAHYLSAFKQNIRCFPYFAADNT